MSEEKEKQWPYYFCGKCLKLAPISLKNGNRFCLKCGYVYEQSEGGRLVYLSMTEARLRGLVIVNPDTKELEDED